MFDKVANQRVMEASKPSTDVKTLRLQDEYIPILFARGDYAHFMAQLDELGIPAGKLSARMPAIIGEMKRLRFQVKDREGRIDQLLDIRQVSDE